MNRVRSRPVLPNFVLPYLAWGVLLFLLAASVEAAPVVSSITPDAARPGDVLEVKGTGFKGTREVLFVSGYAVKPAKFKVLSDEQLDVTFPEYYRGTGSASIIVVGSNGVTVAMSDKMKTVDANTDPGISAPFLNIVKDGTVTHGGGIAVVGEGGIVVKSSSSAVCFVKKHGTLAEFGGAIIFHEPGAIFGPKFQKMRMPPKLISVHEITISPHIEPVTIKTPEAPQPFAKHPPVLASITPAQAMPGDIVVVKGKNFSHVSAVYFVDTTRGPSEAGFKATNDDVLRVEIPQHIARRQLLVVVNPAGAAVNITENPVPPPQFLNRQEAQAEFVSNSMFLVEYVRSGQILNSGNGGRIFVIEKGGTVTSAGGGCCFLVRSGGRLANRFGGGCTIFHETDATVPLEAGGQNQPAGLTSKDVGKLIFSPHPLHLDIVFRY